MRAAVMAQVSSYERAELLEKIAMPDLAISTARHLPYLALAASVAGGIALSFRLNCINLQYTM